MPYKTQAQLANLFNKAAQKVTIGSHYTHYKDETRLYEVVGFSIIESTTAIAVIYRAEYGDRITFVRPLAEWLETVLHDGRRVPRFQKIECPCTLAK